MNVGLTAVRNMNLGESKKDWDTGYKWNRFLRVKREEFQISFGKITEKL